MVPHTIVVDFAVGLLVSSVAFDLLGRVADDRDLHAAGWWTLLFGSLAAAFAVLSGYDAAADAPATEAVTRTLERHRTLGLVVLGCFGTCAVWRGALRGRLPDRLAVLYWGLSAVGVAAIAVAAYLGGVLVFGLGVGVTAPGG